MKTSAKERLNGRIFLAGSFLFQIGLVAVLCGCGSPRRGAPVAGVIRYESEELEKGRLSYMEYCHICHPGGEGGLGPSLNDKPLPRFAIRTQVRQGFGVMPSLSDEILPPEELENLISYMIALRQRER